jgi:FkbM family methyltransferase
MKVEIREFIPPIVYRAIGGMRKRIEQKFSKKFGAVLHPFDSIPLNSSEVKWVLDIGANRGDVAAAALRSYPNSSVVCIEPVSETFKILEQNLACFGSRVIFKKYAFSDVAGEGEINLTNFDGANSILPQAERHQKWNPHVLEQGREKISLKRLDDELGSLPSSIFDIVKIDVEGFEVKVIEGGMNFLRDHTRSILIEISFMRDTSLSEQSVYKIFGLLHQLGYALVNLIDIYPGPNDSPNLRIAQVDCIFLNTKFITR